MSLAPGCIGAHGARAANKFNVELESLWCFLLLGCGQTLNHPSCRERYFTWFTNIVIQHHSLPEALRLMLHHFPTLLGML
jgi:hypothetical protein